MAAISDADLLIAVDEAIQAVLLGQAYQINGRQLTRANLQTLWQMKKEVELRINRASDQTGGIDLVEFNAPS